MATTGISWEDFWQRKVWPGGFVSQNYPTPGSLPRWHFQSVHLLFHSQQPPACHRPSFHSSSEPIRFDYPNSGQVTFRLQKVSLNKNIANQSICFHINSMNPFQYNATLLSLQQQSMICSASTFGKSFIYQAFPTMHVHDYCAKHSTWHFAVVVSPLVNLIKDQVKQLRDLGVSQWFTWARQCLLRQCQESGVFSHLLAESWDAGECFLVPLTVRNWAALQLMRLQCCSVKSGGFWNFPTSC